MYRVWLVVGTELCLLYLKRSDAELSGDFKPVLQITKFLNSDRQTLDKCE